jgi:AraC family chitin signaling transcriptional activator
VRVKFFQIILLLFYSGLQSQELLPFVENFTKSEYRGDNQVWNVVQAADHALYFANNHYFLRYNGVVWEKYSLPDKTIIRSLFADGDRIYCGSYREFGYWKRVSGTMRYFSLSKNKRLFEGLSDNEEIWKIFVAAGKIYFQSFNELFILDQSKIRKIRFPSQISYCYLIDGTIYAASVKDGIYTLRNDQFVAASGFEKLKDNVVHHIERHNGKLYFFTKNNGIYISDANGVHSWANPLNEVLKNEVIITAKFTGGTLAIGTALKGLYLVKLADNSWRNINRENSLKNNAVLSIAVDAENDLWLGLDNGISHIETNSPVSLFLDNSGMLGSVYSLSAMSGGYLFATNHGVFKSRQGKLEVVDGSQGQAWDIFNSGSGLVIGHNDGTFMHSGNGLQKVNPVNGGWKFFDSEPDKAFFQANYSGIAIYQDKHDLSKWKTFAGLTKPIRNIGQEKAGELWAADNYRGLYRIAYDKDFNTVSIDDVSAQSGIANDFSVKIFNYQNKLRFLIGDDWHNYDRNKQKLQKDRRFNAEFKDVSDVIPVDASSFMVAKGGMLYLVSEAGRDFSWKPIPERYYQGKLIAENIKANVIGKDILVNLDDGFLAFDKSRSGSGKSEVKLEAFYHNALVSNDAKIRYNESVEIHAVPKNYGYSRPDVLFRLNGEGKFFRSRTGRIVLANLGSGSQSLEVFTNSGNRVERIAGYRFKVGYPWYFSFGMIVFYIVFLGAISYLYYKWNNIRYRQKLALREEELRHQKDIMELTLNAENERRIREYEKQILELEIKSKSSEVAGKSFSIAKQSEVIDNIRKILDNETDVQRLKGEVKRAIKTNSINRREWETFESSIKHIHSPFVADLIRRYPDLTSKDIKLSIYLKMNLSSKEIAPLMNISFRGVELHRYRLRKKLGLEQDVNLNKFMLAL